MSMSWDLMAGLYENIRELNSILEMNVDFKHSLS